MAGKARLASATSGRTIWVLALVLTAASHAQEPADRLVSQLGAPRFIDREQAARDLVALGSPALPALRRARQSPDPEIRDRALPLIQRIYFAQAIAPTRVALDFRDRPLQEVLRALEARSGIPIWLDPRAGKAVAARPITLESAHPLPFWEAIDRLVVEARLRSDLRPVSREGTGGVRPTLVLEEAGDRLAPAVNWGPFRLKLQSLVERRELNLDPAARPMGDEPPPPSWMLSGRLHLLAEPRLSVDRAGAVRLKIATDDQGRSLLPETPSPHDAGSDLENLVHRAEFSKNPEMAVPLTFSPSGSRLGRSFRLEGVLPVAVVAMSPDATEIPLAGAVGKTFETDDLAITIVAVGPRPEDGRTVLDLAVRSLLPMAEDGSAPAAASMLVDRQIELRDDRGRALPIFMQRAEAEGPALRFRVVVLPTPEGGEPVSLRYRSLLRGVVEVPFRFRDVPLP